MVCSGRDVGDNDFGLTMTFASMDHLEGPCMGLTYACYQREMME